MSKEDYKTQIQRTCVKMCNSGLDKAVKHVNLLSFCELLANLAYSMLYGEYQDAEVHFGALWCLTP